MRERLLWSSIVLLGLMLALARAQTPARPEGQVGRYQIVTVSGNNNEEAQAFKIDSVTGKTWVKAYLVEGNAKNPQWVIMPDYAPRQQK